MLLVWAWVASTRSLRRRVRELDGLKRSQSTRYGQTMEQFAPFLADWPWDPKGFRFIGSPVDGVQFNADGVCVYGTNTNLEEFQPTEIHGDAVVTFKIDHLDLVEGTYRLDLAAHKTDGYPYDYHRLLYTFRVKSRIRDVGIYRPDHKWEFGGGIKFSDQK